MIIRQGPSSGKYSRVPFRSTTSPLPFPPKDARFFIQCAHSDTFLAVHHIKLDPRLRSSHSDFGSGGTCSCTSPIPTTPSAAALHGTWPSANRYKQRVFFALWVSLCVHAIQRSTHDSDSRVETTDTAGRVPLNLGSPGPGPGQCNLRAWQRVCREVHLGEGYTYTNLRNPPTFGRVPTPVRNPIRQIGRLQTSHANLLEARIASRAGETWSRRPGKPSHGR